jgi:glycosyltransferase involved in cell wall biosynthesis
MTHATDRAPSTYVLVTPARDEEAYIGLTLDSVIRQTVRPLRWVIVSDGSTDATDAIVRRYQARHDWIDLLRMPDRAERHFAGKAQCFNAGYATVRRLASDLVGNLDADVSLDEDHFAFLIERFAERPRLGVAGTPFREGEARYDFRFSSDEHVSGACQLFRRECLEAVGGYLPLAGGGIDVVAVLTARLNGWETRSFTERSYVHHRPMGSARHGTAVARFKLGERDYVLGRHPLWQVCRAIYQMRRRPRLVGGCLLIAGYLSALLRRAERPLPQELIRFQRHEQMQRLRKFLIG